MRVFLLSKEYNGESIYHLNAREKRYLLSVLRLKVNSSFVAKNEKGVLYNAFLFSEEALALEELKEEDSVSPALSSYTGPFPEMTVCIALLKGKKNEIEARMLTEIGATSIILMETEFSEGDMNKHAAERIETIMREAVQQSGAELPSITGPVSFDKALGMIKGRAVILHQSQRGKTLMMEDALSEACSATLFIGPEGGFSDTECKKAEDAGVIPVLLPTNILRAETASVYATAFAQTILSRNLRTI